MHINTASTLCKEISRSTLQPCPQSSFAGLARGYVLLLLLLHHLLLLLLHLLLLLLLVDHDDSHCCEDNPWEMLYNHFSSSLVQINENEGTENDVDHRVSVLYIVHMAMQTRLSPQCRGDDHICVSKEIQGIFEMFTLIISLLLEIFPCTLILHGQPEEVE